MAPHPLTQALANQLLSYDPNTGVLYWKARDISLFSDDSRHPQHVIQSRWNTRYAGTKALTGTAAKGYKAGSMLNKRVYAHRIIFLLAHGRWPNEIDHINGVITDNRLDNLRDVSRTDNMRNLCRNSRNVSGVSGVRNRSDCNRWVASIQVAGRDKHLGLFQTFEQAVAARKQAETALGFHKNHGRPNLQLWRP